MTQVFSTVSNPRWANAEHTAVDVIVTLASMPGVSVGFTATPTDPEAHGRHVYEQAIQGAYGPVAPFSGDLADYRAKRLVDLGQQRWRRQCEGVYVLGHRFSTRPEDVLQVNALLIQVEHFGPDVIDYKSLTGFVKLNYSHLLEVLQAMHRHVQRCFTIEAQHTAKLNALTDRDALLHYDITKGW